MLEFTNVNSQRAENTVELLAWKLVWQFTARPFEAHITWYRGCQRSHLLCGPHMKLVSHIYLPLGETQCQHFTFVILLAYKNVVVVGGGSAVFKIERFAGGDWILALYKVIWLFVVAVYIWIMWLFKRPGRCCFVTFCFKIFPVILSSDLSNTYIH